jgi:hypothetical protein
MPPVRPPRRLLRIPLTAAIAVSLVLCAAALALCAATLAPWVRSSRGHSRDAESVRRAGTTLPAEEVVYDTDAGRARTLLTADSRYEPIPFSPGAQRRAPRTWREMDLPELSRTTLFSGTLRGKAGEERLVAVQIGGVREGVVRSLGLVGEVVSFDPSGKARIVTNGGNESPLMFSNGDVVRIYSGQRDLHDPTHFTIRYETLNGTGFIDGWLETPDTVRIEVRDGPARSAKDEYDAWVRKYSRPSPEGPSPAARTK